MDTQQIKDIFSKPYGRLLVLFVIGILVLIGVLIGHRLQQDRHTAYTVKDWKAKNNYLITNLADDFKLAQKDALANNSKALSTDCGLIKKDALNAESKPAIPQSNIEVNWKAGLHDDATGGELCMEAVSQSSSAKFTTASTDFTNGSKALAAANTQLTAVVKKK